MTTSRERNEYERLRAAIAGEPLPLALVDLDAFDRNLDGMLAAARPHGKPLRLASKSIRCTALLVRALERGGDGVRGVMAFTVPEAAHLVEHGVRDILVAYPTAQPADARLLRQLNARDGVRVAVIADAVEHLDALQAGAGEGSARIPVVVEVDLAWRLFGGALHIGARRSPLHSPEQVLAVVDAIGARDALRFCGIMGYESQVAGLTDKNPFTPLMNPFKAFIRRHSVKLAARRRARLRTLVEGAGHAIEIFNGGGSGSVASTASEDAITEVAAGSGLLAGHLFDYYTNVRFEPCAYFALQVVRRPHPGFATCLGGGYVASGEPGVDRLPRPVLPAGLGLTGFEAAGEVQTPVTVPAGVELPVGAPVFFRHAKSGELAERFDTYLLVRGGQIVDRVPTYRGEGRAFL